MDYKCWCCPAEAIWVCDCPQDSRSCEKHYRDHKKKYKRCLPDFVKDAIIESDNAIKCLELEYAKLTQDMMIEIENYYNQNLNYLHSKKNEARGFIYRKMNDEADGIKVWARTLNLKERDKNQFLFSMREILGIDSASSNIAIAVENLEQTCERIEEIENKFNYRNEENREFQIKVQDEENIKKMTVDEFMSKINKENYQSFEFEEIKYIMIELNFEGFKEEFITDRYQFIVQISHTNDKKYIFVCKFLSRL
ncbi:hypothetical protein SteCoe_38128 [Stentor coeruleus]|uniref:Uncharacterized protein n=1 Tax=Stentor coeruleus TaxID=5963 RepID=A0A1R2ALS1_9CILI|nr:hypothetical protein SteCoe_38128 [Stentor coeruleus]